MYNIKCIIFNEKNSTVKDMSPFVHPPTHRYFHLSPILPKFKAEAIINIHSNLSYKCLIRRDFSSVLNWKKSLLINANGFLIFSCSL